MIIGPVVSRRAGSAGLNPSFRIIGWPIPNVGRGLLAGGHTPRLREKLLEVLLSNNAGALQPCSGSSLLAVVERMRQREPAAAGGSERGNCALLVPWRQPAQRLLLKWLVRENRCTPTI